MDPNRKWITHRDRYYDTVTIYPNGDIQKGCALKNPELLPVIPIEGHRIYAERDRFFSRMSVNVATSCFLNILGPVAFRKVSTTPSTTTPEPVFSHKTHNTTSTSTPIPIPTKMSSTSKLFEKEDNHE